MVVPHPQNGSSTTSQGFVEPADNAFEKRLRFLCRVTETLLSLRTDYADIIPEVLKLNSRMLISVIF